MRPPSFGIHNRLVDWSGCFLEINCSCGRTVVIPVREMYKERGDMSFNELVTRLVCSQCRRKPAPVYLCATHYRRYSKGQMPGWAVEVVAK